MDLEGGPGLEFCPSVNHNLHQLIIISDEYIITYLPLTYYQGYQTLCRPSFWGLMGAQIGVPSGPGPGHICHGLADGKRSKLIPVP